MTFMTGIYTCREYKIVVRYSDCEIVYETFNRGGLL